MIASGDDGTFVCLDDWEDIMGLQNQEADPVSAEMVQIKILSCVNSTETICKSAAEIENFTKGKLVVFKSVNRQVDFSKFDQRPTIAFTK